MREQFSDSDSATIWLEDNIIHIVFKKVNVELPEAVAAVDLATKIVQNRSLGYFIDISNIKSISKEAREYFSIPRSVETNLATAVLAPNIISKLIGTFFMSFNNPGVKIKLFTVEDEAIAWLKKQLT